MEENHLYEIEISPKEIIKIMKSNIYDNFLKKSYHFISSDYLISRSSLFSLIRKISNRLGFKSQTYFLSIYYLDILFCKNKKIDCNYKILGLACLLLSAKYIENDPCVPNLANFIKAYNTVIGYKYIISVSDLFYAEVLTCKMLGYKLNYYTIYDFDSFFFGHGIIKIEQLKDLNIENYSNISSNNFEINATNSIYIRKILEKIYRKSRHYLELIVKNTQLCLKYNSLLISIFIMKKSVEEILLDEQRINKHDLLNKENFLIKNSKCFKEIMKELYQIDYESMESYIELISDKELIKLLKEEKKSDLSPALVDLENNIKLANNNNDKEKSIKSINNQNTISAYSHTNRLIPEYNNNNSLDNNNILNSSLKEDKMQKMNFTRNYIKYNNYKNLFSQPSERSSYKSRYKNTSISKKYNLLTNRLDLSNLSSTTELNRIETKGNNYKESRALYRNSEINYLKYLERITTYYDDRNKRRNDSNSIAKKNNQSFSMDNDDDLRDIISSMETNNNLYKNKMVKKGTPVKFEKYNGYNYDNYKKMNGLKRKIFNRINSSSKNYNNYSTSLLENSNTRNTAKNLEDENNSKYYKKLETKELKPYFRKVIRNTAYHNTINNFNNLDNTKSLKQGITQNTSNISHFSIINNDKKGEKYNSIMVNNNSLNNRENIEINFDSNLNSSRYDKKEDSYEIEYKNKYSNTLNIDNKGKSKIKIMKDNQISFVNVNSSNTININNDLNHQNKDITIIKDNEKKIKVRKITEEEFKLNKKNEENNEIKEEPEKNQNKSNVEIYSYSSSNSYISKRKERERLLLNRMKNINKTKINENKIIMETNEYKENKTEIKNNKKISDDSKTKDNNEINYNRRIKRTENKNEEKEINSNTEQKSNIVSKRKYFLLNKNTKNLSCQIQEEKNINSNKNKKEKIYENQIDLNNTNKNISQESLSYNEKKNQSIRYKYINKMHNKNGNLMIYNNKKEKKEEEGGKESIDKIDNNNENNNIIKKDYKNNKNKYDLSTSNKPENEDKKEQKNNLNKNIKNKNEIKNKIKELEIKGEEKEQKNYPTSSIFKLLHKTKTLNEKNIELSKGELDLELSNKYVYNYNKRSKLFKTIRTINHSESKGKEINENIINKETLIPEERVYKTINTDINDVKSNLNNDEWVIHSYHQRNLLKHKIKKNLEDSNNNSNKNINIDSNKTANTIVINNNININFNNKIEPFQGRYVRNNILKRNITEINNNDYYNKFIINNKNINSHRKIIIEKYYDSNKYNKITDKKYYNAGTIKCIDINNNMNNQNNSISSLLHKLPFYKKTLGKNRITLQESLQ